jgi:hypothetical protein
MMSMHYMPLRASIKHSLGQFNVAPILILTGIQI